MSPLWTKDTFGNTFLENFHKNLRELISKIIAENMWVFNFLIINCYVWDSETVTWTPIIYVSEPLKNKHEVFFRDEALKSDGCEKKARKKISPVNYWDRNIPAHYWWALPPNFTLSRQSSSQNESVKYFHSCIQVFGDFAVFICQAPVEDKCH